MAPTPDVLDKIASGLGRSILFRRQGLSTLRRIAEFARMEPFMAGEELVTVGAAADAFYVLLEGEAEVLLPTPKGELVSVRRLQAPAGVGEMGLLLDRPRNATVRATDTVLAARFERGVFEQMFDQVPGFGMGACQSMAERLATLNSQIPTDDSEAALPEPSAEAVGMLPRPFMERQRVVVLSVHGGTAKVGFVDEITPVVLDRVRGQLPGLHVEAQPVPAAWFDEALRTTTGIQPHSAPPALDADTRSEPRSPELDALLERMVAEGASDLHLSAGLQPRWRVDGEILRIADMTPLGLDSVAQLIDPILRGDPRQAFFSTGDCDFAYAIAGTGRFRVAVFRDHQGVSAAIRHVPARILSLQQLGMPESVTTLADQPHGLVLVSGPTGSGKSTTLAAVLDRINRSKRCHIITLEDPIEFVHDSKEALVNQREVGAHAGSFVAALRAALRQDPDVVLVGELRDAETAALALQMASTGHLVLATLRTRSSAVAVRRVLDFFSPGERGQVRATLSACLRGVITQVLCRREGGGRVAAVEVLAVHTALAGLIRDGRIDELDARLADAPHVRLVDSLAALVADRVVSREEAEALAPSPRALAAALESLA